MSVSRLQLVKSETRDLAEHARIGIDLRFGDGSSDSPSRSIEWQMSDSTFFTAFVAIAAVLALLALILR